MSAKYIELSENSDYKIQIMSSFCIELYREPNKPFQKFEFRDYSV